MNRPSRRRGFTLIEALAALLLVAIVLPAALRGISAATHASSISRRRTEAAALASSKLNELVGTQQWQVGTMNGDFGDESPGYQWTATVQDWSEADLWQLDVSVTWGDRRPDQTVTLTTLIYPNAPTAAQSSQTNQSTSPKRGPNNGNTGGEGLP